MPPENNEASPGTETNGAMFQAIGVIESVISVNENSQLSITLGNQKYRLGYTGKSRNRDYAKLLCDSTFLNSNTSEANHYIISSKSEGFGASYLTVNELEKYIERAIRTFLKNQD